MAAIDLVNQENVKVGSVNLNDAVFGVSVNYPLVHQVIKAQLAGRRQGTASTKTKGEVRGGGRKPFKQKGTGNARQGSSRSPLKPGGGSTFGPRPRSYEQATPKEMIKGAIRSVLSDRLAAGRLIIVDQFNFKEPKTKVFASILNNKFKCKNVLIVDAKNENLERSGRNVPLSKILRVEGINVYDVVAHDWLILSKQAVEAIESRLAV